MKISGYKMQHALRELTHVRDLAATQFTNGLMAFPNENKPTPEKAMALYQDAESKIALLQVAQAEYNLRASVRVQDKVMPLSQAIKLVGGAGRAEKMWRTACADKVDRYGYSAETRNKDEISKERQVSVETAMLKAKEAAKWASALREAIQVGNATEIDIERLVPALFEE